MAERPRSYCVTINNPTNDDCLSILYLEPIVTYMVFADEVGKKRGTPHLQGFIHFKDGHSFKSVSKKLSRARLAVMKGNFDQNEKYCSKEKQWDLSRCYVYGTKPSPGKACWDKVVTAMQNPADNFQVYHQYRRAYNEYTSSIVKDHQRVLFLIHKSDYRKYMITYKPTEVCPLGSEYAFERVYFRSVYYGDCPMIHDWHCGYPHKESYGYEYRYIDPEIIYLCYDDNVDYCTAMKYFGEIIEN